MFKPIRHGMVALAIISIILMFAVAAEAQVSMVTSRVAIAGDDYVDWGQAGAAGALLPASFSVTSNLGKSVTVSQNSASFYRYDQGTNWNGNFAKGDKLIYNPAASTVSITFSSPVAAAGTQLQGYNFGNFQGWVEAYDLANARIAQFSLNGYSSGAQNNSAIFLGVSSASGNIKKLVYYTTVSGITPFAFNRLEVKSAAFPAPTVTAIAPPSGDYATRIAVAEVSGTNFVSGASVKLARSGSTDIIASNISVVSSSRITCTFDLPVTAYGVWNVVVTNPDGQSATLANAFTVNTPNLTVVTNRALLAADDYLDWGQSPEGANLGPSPYMYSSLGKLIITSQTMASFVRRNEGTSWTGNFANGDKLIFTQAADKVTIDFPTGVAGVGAQLQTSGYGAFTGNIELYDAKNNRIGQYSLAGNSSNARDNSAIFLGAYSAFANIKRVVYYTTQNGPQVPFLLNKLSIKTSSSAPNPMVASVTPSSSYLGGYVSHAEVVGVNFKPGATVKLMRGSEVGSSCLSEQVSSDGKSLVCSFAVPATVGVWDLVVANPDGSSATLPNGFTVLEDTTPPQILSVTPTVTKVGPGESVELTVMATDDAGIKLVTVEGISFEQVGKGTFSGVISASAELGSHTITVQVEDPSGHTATDTSASYTTLRVVGMEWHKALESPAQAGMGMFRYRVYGKVSEVGDANHFSFSDETQMLNVSAQGHSVKVGDLVAVRGFLLPGGTMLQSTVSPTVILPAP